MKTDAAHCGKRQLYFIALLGTAQGAGWPLSQAGWWSTAWSPMAGLVASQGAAYLWSPQKRGSPQPSRRLCSQQGSGIHLLIKAKLRWPGPMLTGAPGWPHPPRDRQQSQVQAPSEDQGRHSLYKELWSSATCTQSSLWNLCWCWRGQKCHPWHYFQPGGSATWAELSS